MIIQQRIEIWRLKYQQGYLSQNRSLITVHFEKCTMCIFQVVKNSYNFGTQANTAKKFAEYVE